MSFFFIATGFEGEYSVENVGSAYLLYRSPDHGLPQAFESLILRAFNHYGKKFI
jgi:hypothetical protein